MASSSETRSTVKEALSAIFLASASGTSPSSAHALVAAISTFNQAAYLFSKDQILPISGRV